MIVKVRNKTANALVTLGLGPDETKVIFYNRTFFKKQKEIDQALVNDEIEFLDDEGAVIVAKNPDYIAKINFLHIGHDDLQEMFLKLKYKWTGDDESIIFLEREIGLKIEIAIKTIFKKKVKQGLSYTRTQLKTALNGKIDLLRTGDLEDAKTALSTIPNDAFFTTAVKTRIKNLFDSIDLN